MTCNFAIGRDRITSRWGENKKTHGKCPRAGLKCLDNGETYPTIIDAAEDVGIRSGTLQDRAYKHNPGETFVCAGFNWLKL